MMELFEDTAGVRAGLAGSVLVFHHYAPIRHETARVLERVNRRAFAAGARLAVIVVIEPDLRPPESDVRSAVVAITKKTAPNVIAMAHVVRGQGFLTAAFRTALAGLSLVARLEHPLKVFATIAEALLWLRPQLKVASMEAPSAADVEALVANDRS
jgi:hypothetical protein